MKDYIEQLELNITYQNEETQAKLDQLTSTIANLQSNFDEKLDSHMSQSINRFASFAQKVQRDIPKNTVATQTVQEKEEEKETPGEWEVGFETPEGPPLIEDDKSV